MVHLYTQIKACLINRTKKLWNTVLVINTNILYRPKQRRPYIYVFAFIPFFLSESVLIQADFWFFMYELTCIRVGLCTTYALYSKYQCSRYRISTVLCCAMTHFVKFHVLVHLTHFVN